MASTAQDDELLLEQEILRHHRSHATGAAQLSEEDLNALVAYLTASSHQ